MSAGADPGGTHNNLSGGSQENVFMGRDFYGPITINSGDKAESGAVPSSVSWPLRIGIVPTLATAFQPRTDIRQEIEAAHLQHSAVVLTQVLTGGGGVGKSQLAAFYATQAAADDRDLVLWVNASDLEQIISSYAHAGRLVQAPGAVSEDIESDARAFLNWLATTSRSWLIVLDDITNPQNLANWWPNGAPRGKGQVLATTRRRDAVLSGGGRAVIEVDAYTEVEALTYLETRLTDAGTAHLLDEQATAVAAELGRLPLALSHAAAYMINEDIPCSSYLELFSERSRMQDLLPGDADTEGYGRQVATALLLGLEAAQQCPPTGLAIPALRLAAHLDPAGHPQTLWTTEAITTYLTRHRTPISDEAVGDVDARQAKAALRVLHRYALLTSDPNSSDRSVRLHALTARAVRETIPTDRISGIAPAAANALSTIWPEEDHTDRELCTTLRANTDTLTHHAEEYIWRAGSTSVIYRAGKSLLDAGLYFAAVHHWQRVASNAKLHVGPNHDATLQARAMLAGSHRAAGHADEAITIQERLASDREHIQGFNHPDTLTSWNNLAASYQQAGRSDEAINIEERVAADRERTLGSNHPDTLTSWNNLAVFYQQAGNTDEAINIQQRVAGHRERTLGPNHPDTLTSWNNLAVSYAQIGRTQEALTIQERVAANRERTLGPNHPDTLASWNNLAAFYSQAGRSDEAINIEERVAADHERTLGPNHPDTLRIWNNLAVSYAQIGRTQEALTIQERVAANRERTLGPNHPETRKSQAWLREWAAALGR